MDARVGNGKDMSYKAVVKLHPLAFDCSTYVCVVLLSKCGRQAALVQESLHVVQQLLLYQQMQSEIDIVPTLA